MYKRYDRHVDSIKLCHLNIFLIRGVRNKTVVAEFVDNIVKTNSSQNIVNAKDERTETIIERNVVQNNVIRNVINMEVVHDVIGNVIRMESKV